MFLNYGSGGSGGSSGGNTIINTVGSQNYLKATIAEMEAIPSPKKGDVCYVNGGGLYMYDNGMWKIIPTGDMFYNKLASTTDVGHVKLTSDITLDSEDVAITPKALKDAIEELRELLEGSDWEDLEQGQWDELFDGVDDNPTLSEWDDLQDGADDTESEHTWDEW